MPRSAPARPQPAYPAIFTGGPGAAPHLAAYDVADPRRLRGARALLLEHAADAQRSVYECLLAPGDPARLRRQIEALLDPRRDRFLLVRLDPRGPIRGHRAEAPASGPGCLYLG
jgi:CRISPR-associated protein Cas2